MELFTSIPVLIWLLFSGVFVGLGDYFSKKFAIEPSWKHVAPVFAMYILSMLAWLPAIVKNDKLSIVGVI